MAEVEKALQAKSDSVDIILTGSRFPQVIMDLADLITEVVDLKHAAASDISS